MVDISWKTYEKKIVETTVDSDGMLWLNGKHIKEGLDHKNLSIITKKCLSNYTKHKYELVQLKEQPNRFFFKRRISNQNDHWF